MILKFQWLACVAMLLGATFTSTCNAGLIFSFNPATSLSSSTISQDITIGYSFNVGSSVSVDGLGFWDEGGDGLSYDHRVRLWQVGNATALADVMVTNASTVDTVNGAGRWLVSGFGPIVLGAGQYIVGADYIQSAPIQDAFRLSFVPQSLLSSNLGSVTTGIAMQTSTGLGLPNTDVSGVFSNGFAGPNLRITAVPEPSSMALLGIAGLGFGWRKLRKKTAKKS